MIKANKTILKETAYIASCVAIFSIVMQIVFVILGRWDYKVLLGNIWGALIVIANFYFMGLGVQKAVETSENETKRIMKISHSMRTMFLFVTVVIGVVLPFFSTIATIIPLFFPRIAIAFRPLMKEKQVTEEVAFQNETK